jgi:hypothetical protein
MQKSAVISSCGKFRYTLRRIWGDGPRLMVVMLNPSTADGSKDDPTITRLIRRCRDESFEGFIVCNLYALRATNPVELEYGWAKCTDIVGPTNMQAIRETMHECDECLVAWGAHPMASKRDRLVLDVLYERFSNALGCGTSLWMIDQTKDGFPKHPLHVAYSRGFQRYAGRFSR